MSAHARVGFVQLPPFAPPAFGFIGRLPAFAQHLDDPALAARGNQPQARFLERGECGSHRPVARVERRRDRSEQRARASRARRTALQFAFERCSLGTRRRIRLSLPFEARPRRIFRLPPHVQQRIECKPEHCRAITPATVRRKGEGID
jgi:hypothetical protein